MHIDDWVPIVLELAYGGVIAALIVVLGYKWGSFASLQAFKEHSRKWKAYALALIPPLAMALTLTMSHPQQLGLAYKTFWAVAAPTIIGACIGYNRRKRSEMLQQRLEC
jgi:succinate-acetate transporter protein